MTEGVMPDYQKDEWEKNLEMVRKMTGGGPGAGGTAEREAIALERIADTLDNIAALLASQCVPAGSAHPVGKNGDDEGWIEWRGGSCPVPSGTFVDAKFRGGYAGYDLMSSALAWDHLYLRSPADIMAYRIHKPQGGKAE